MVNVATTMSALGTALRTITGLRVYDYPTESISVPCAIVAFPDKILYDDVMGGHSDCVDIQVHVIVGNISNRTTPTRLGEYMTYPGAPSVKSAIEADPTLKGVVQTTRVTEAQVSIMNIANVDYLAATFSTEIYT